MKTTFNQSGDVQIREYKSNQISLPEWEDITQAQKTATFSLIAIALFVVGLIASNGADVRRRVSSYIYTLATISSWLAVYVTFPDDPPVLQSFALATVVALLGYTISSTLLGHATLYLASVGTLVGLGFETVDSENLRLYTQLSLTVAFALTWMAISAIRIVDQDLGLIVSSLTILGAAQVAFFREYENLSYFIAVGLILISIWLYTKIGSWILAASAMTALGAGAAEFVISTMDNSFAAIIGMLLVGGIATTMGIRAAGSRNG
jgi:hypothetical protein